MGKLLNETAKFNETIKGDDAAQGLQRAFLNYDVDQYFNMRTMKTRNDIVVWTMLTGPKEKVSKLHDACN